MHHFIMIKVKLVHVHFEMRIYTLIEQQQQVKDGV